MHHPSTFPRRAVALAIAAALLPAAVQASEVRLPRIDVVGHAEEDVTRQPGAVSIVTSEELETLQPRSTDEALRRVPGVYVKGEEESAVVTNIGVRGLPAADYKTLVLEDGVPVQPGIFVGNSRYYNPRVQRMEGMEVLRGASSLRYGPNSIGGVINFQTRTPEPGVALIGRAGSWNTQETAVELGGRSPSGDAVFGLFATHANSDGFMDKGYEMTDVMVKAGTAIGDNQFVGVKFSYYESEANISYRGIFPDAFDAYKGGATLRNPAPDDWFLSGRTGFDVNHDWDINPNMRLSTLLYWSETYRDYWRFRLGSQDGHGGTDTVTVNGVTQWSYNNRVNGNNRTFNRIGLDSRLTWNHTAFGIANEAEFGLRLMQEEMSDKVVEATRATPRTGTLSRDRVDSADNLALFAQNRFDINDQLSMTAGLRMESYRQKRDNLQNTAPAETFSDTQYMPGIGATYWLTPSVQLYGSVYRAFAPPLVGSVLGGGDRPTNPEKSVNTEIGMRGASGLLNYEVTAFQMDFSNHVDPGISNIRNPDEGSALIRGLEAGLGYALGNDFRLDGNVTWIPTAKYGENRFNTGGNLVARKGNRLPYSPEWMANLALTYKSGPLQAALLANYTGMVYGNGMNMEGADARGFIQTGVWGGRIPAYHTFDLTGRYAVNDQFSLFGAIKNLTDERYISGLRQGIYVGPERSFELGLRYQF